MTTFFTLRNDVPKDCWLPILSTAVEIFCRVSDGWINADIESLKIMPEGFMNMLSQHMGGFHPGMYEIKLKKNKKSIDYFNEL